jgi:tetraacyldisaccharide 4'-kinase
MNKSFFEYIFLGPFALLYDIITEIRNKLYDWDILSSEEFNFPVISVGNLTIGGTGKTPHIEYLIQLLTEKKYRVAVLSRGYKRKKKGFQDSSLDASFDALGDELYQMHLKFPHVEFFAHSNRVEGVRNILQKNNCDVILLDDAFQHRKIKPGYSILLNDYNRPIYEDHILPLGRLREHEHQKKRAQVVITSKCPNELKPIDQRIVYNNLKLYPYQNLFFSALYYKKVKAVFDSGQEFNSLEDFFKRYKQIVFFTGIAQPQHFEKEVRKYIKNIKYINFPDHHLFSSLDIQKIENEFLNLPDGSAILTSEKDASRLKEFYDGKTELKKHYFYTEIEIDFLSEKEVINEQILNYVASNRRKY